MIVHALCYALHLEIDNPNTHSSVAQYCHASPPNYINMRLKFAGRILINFQLLRERKYLPAFAKKVKSFEGLDCNRVLVARESITTCGSLKCQQVLLSIRSYTGCAILLRVAAHDVKVIYTVVEGWSQW